MTDEQHYCIQADRIAKMDKKLDEIHDQFQVDGTIGKMSGQLTRLTALMENGRNGRKPPKNGDGGVGPIPPKLVWWIIAGLVAIVAALAGANIPL